jgi:hypothetical protein
MKQNIKLPIKLCCLWLLGVLLGIALIISRSRSQDQTFKFVDFISVAVAIMLSAGVFLMVFYFSLKGKLFIIKTCVPDNDDEIRLTKTIQSNPELSSLAWRSRLLMGCSGSFILAIIALIYGSYGHWVGFGFYLSASHLSIFLLIQMDANRRLSKQFDRLIKSISQIQQEEGHRKTAAGNKYERNEDERNGDATS